MIIGIGTDVLIITRLAAVYERFPERLCNRLLTSYEKAQLTQMPDARLLAKRFAVKEACAKALGTGIGGGLSFLDLELYYQGPRPFLRYIGKNPIFAGYVYHMSISDEKDQVLAFVIVEDTYFPPLEK